jgi:hypothetical protein
LQAGERERRNEAPEFDCGGHPTGLVVVHELPPSDGDELFGVDVFWRHAEALEAVERGREHRRWSADEDVGGAQV